MLDLIERISLAGIRRADVADALGRPHEDRVAETVATLRAEHGAGADDPDDQVLSPLDDVAAVFGLDPDDARLLWCAAAADLDASVGLAYAELLGAPGSTAPTVALALEMVAVGTATPEAFGRLGPDGPLRRHGLLEVDGPEPWLQRRLRVPETVTAVLAGGRPGDPLVESLRVDLVALDVPGSQVAAASVQAGVPLVWVRSGHGMSGSAVAAGAFAQVGLPFLAVDLHRHRGADLVSVVRAVTRDAGLRGRGLVVLGTERADEPDAAPFVGILEHAAVPVVAVSTRPWNSSWSARHPVVVEAGPLGAEDRLGIWATELGEVSESEEGQLRETLLGLRLSAETIVEAARYARLSALVESRTLDVDLVREAVRRIGGSGIAHTGQGMAARTGGPGPRFSDLVLPDHASGSLHRLVSWARRRDLVRAEGMLRGRGRGLAALFTGSPGTGKTLAANVIAEELGIELFQVDLSSIVDKYIGETEKNLERVFQAAEAMDVVLFFDEADALFGSRSGVQDARDRYANQEVAYLLQRMEHFDGITILSTNLRGNLDKAFSRRMSFIVHFPDPDVPTRARLWRHHLDQLPDLDPDDPVDVDGLAEAVALAGGDIRNVVLAAAFDAAGGDELLGHRHVVDATLREHSKLGKVLPAHRVLRPRPVN